MKTFYSIRIGLLAAAAVLSAAPGAEARQGLNARGGADAGAPVTIAPRAVGAGSGLKQTGAAPGSGVVRIAPRGAGPAVRGSLGSGPATVPRMQRPAAVVSPTLRPAVRAPIRGIAPSMDVPSMARRTPGLSGAGRLSPGTTLSRPIQRTYQPVQIEPLKPPRIYSRGLDAEPRCRQLWREYKATGSERVKARYYACKE